jgi:hypothetical protein
VSKADDTFQLATVPSGTAINTSGSQTGTHGFFHLSKEPGIPVIHHDFLAHYCADKFMDEKHPKFGKNRQDLAADIRDIQDYWEKRERMGKTIIHTKQRIYR